MAVKKYNLNSNVVNLNKKINLNNHIVYSHDGGKSFGEAIDTGVQAQASNLLWLEKNIILTIHSHRESPSGLIVRKVNIENDKFEILDELDLFKNENMGSDSTNISKQFGSLKFGQPSLIKLQNNDIGYIVVSEQANDITTAVRERKAFIIRTMIAVVIVILIFSLFLNKYILKPIGLLVKFSDGIKKKSNQTIDPWILISS